MATGYEPFEKIEKDGRTILRLHGNVDQRVEVAADKVSIIMDAIADGWDIDIRYAILKGSLLTTKIKDRLKPDEDGRKIIEGGISIQDSEIQGDTSFWKSSLKGYSDFLGTTFGGYVLFSRCKFHEGARFSECTFKGYAEFKNAVFESLQGDFDFDRAIFGKDVKFEGATFLNYVNHLCGDVSFRRVQFDAVPKFSSGQLRPEDFEIVGQSCRRSGLLGFGHLLEEAGVGYFAEKEYSKAMRSFRNAKVEYGKEGKYDDAGRMYVRERESTRLHLKSQHGNLVKRAWLWIWNHSSNYGESPLRFIGWIAAIVLIFALINLPIISTWLDWWPSITFEKYPFHRWGDGIIDGVLYNIVTALYFSAVTFATLGFGDITPVNILGKICAIAEVLLGYLMFGVLITLVARKMTRN